MTTTRALNSLAEPQLAMRLAVARPLTLVYRVCVRLPSGSRQRKTTLTPLMALPVWSLARQRMVTLVPLWTVPGLLTEMRSVRVAAEAEGGVHAAPTNRAQIKATRKSAAVRRRMVAGDRDGAGTISPMRMVGECESYHRSVDGVTCHHARRSSLGRGRDPR